MGERANLREELAALTDKFTKNGGKIERVEPGGTPCIVTAIESLGSGNHQRHLVTVEISGTNKIAYYTATAEIAQALQVGGTYILSLDLLPSGMRSNFFSKATHRIDFFEPVNSRLDTKSKSAGRRGTGTSGYTVIHLNEKIAGGDQALLHATTMPDRKKISISVTSHRARRLEAGRYYKVKIAPQKNGIYHVVERTRMLYASSDYALGLNL